MKQRKHVSNFLERIPSPWLTLKATRGMLMLNLITSIIFPLIVYLIV